MLPENWFPWRWLKIWRARHVSYRLALAVRDMDQVSVRALVARASTANPRIDLSFSVRSRAMHLAHSTHPRALDYVLASMQRKPLHRQQQACLAIAMILFQNGARLTTRGAAPIGSLALVQSRNLDLLRAACANQPLWRMGFTWFVVRDGRPQPCRVSYEQHCAQEGWAAGADYLRYCASAERAQQEHAIMEQETAQAMGPSKPPGRL